MTPILTRAVPRIKTVAQKAVVNGSNWCWTNQRCRPCCGKNNHYVQTSQTTVWLTTEVRAGIKLVIADMERAGILVKTDKVTCNTPIFPVKKASTGKYRLVHDLRAINEVTEQIPPVVANPHTILNQVTPKEQWFSPVKCILFCAIASRATAPFWFHI